MKTARSAKYSEWSAQGDSFLLTHPEIEEFILKESGPSLEIQVKEFYILQS